MKTRSKPSAENILGGGNTSSVTEIMTRTQFKAASCFSMNFPEHKMCLKCQSFYQRKVRRIGRLPKVDEKPNCEQHWLIKVTKFTKSLTIDKKNAAIETINSLGYTFCDGEMAEEKISKIFGQKKQDIDSDDLMSSGGSLPGSSVESFETLNNSGINPESSNVPNDSHEDGLPSLNLQNPQSNCHALMQPVPFVHATEEPCEGSGFLNLLGSVAALAPPVVPKASTLKPHETVVPRNYLSRLQNESKKYNEIKQKLNKCSKRYRGTDLGKKFMGKAIAIAPQASQHITQSTIPLLYASFCSDLKLPVDYNKIANSTPSTRVINRLLNSEASEYVISSVEKMLQNPFVFISCDKANTGKKGSNFSTMPKVLSYYNPQTGRIEEYLMDVDSAGESSRDAAIVIKHALEKLSLIDPNLHLILCGQDTDSGGGGTLHSLERELRKLDLPFNNYYIISSCSLHNLQTCLRNGVIEVLGEGGSVEDENGTTQFKKNAMQLMHGIWNLTNYLPKTFLRKIWKHSREKLQIDRPYRIFPQPVLTRWWMVGDAACILREDWVIYEEMMKQLANLPRSELKEAAFGIVCANKNLMQKKVIKADVNVIASIHTHFIFPHFKYLQEGDPLTGNVAGYQARSMLVRYFLMHEDLIEIKDGAWMDVDAFKGLVTITETDLIEQERESMKQKMFHIVNIMHTLLHKHFNIWLSQYAFLALFSEQQTAIIIARFLLAYPPQHNSDSTTYLSQLHRRDVNLQKFEQFVREHCKNEQAIRQHQEVTSNAQNIHLIADGLDLWGQHVPPSIAQYRKHYLLHLSSCPTNTQKVERLNKLANHCSIQNRSELSRTNYALANVGTIEKSNEIALDIYIPSSKKQRAIEKHDIIRNKVRGNALVNLVLRENETALEKNSDIEHAMREKRARNVVASNEQHFKAKRDTDLFTSYEQNLDRERNLTQLETRPGVDTTPLLDGRVPFVKMLKDRFRTKIIEELQARGVTPTAEELRNYNKLKTRLKVSEGNKKWFRPMLGLEYFRWW